MQFLVDLPQRLDTGAAPTFAGINGTNGQTITGNSSGAWAIAANGTNQNITLTPSGTGSVNFGTFGGIGPNGGTGFRLTNVASSAFIDINGSGSIGLYANGTNQSILLNPIGTGLVICGSSANGYTFSDGNGYGLYFAGLSTILKSAGLAALYCDNSQNTFLVGSTLVYNGSAAGAVTSSTRFRKAVTAIANASATAVLTVTIPNAAHSASLNVYLTGSLGAGGAIGANEASAAIGYTIAISRTAGVNAVAVASTAFGSATVAVAGAATCTITAVVSAISGAVGATNTFTINVTISRGSGASANHTCQVTAELDNANATGITLA